MKYFWVFLWASLAFCAHAGPLDAEQNKTYQTLIEQTRCVTCQHQNIAESNAPVAEAMRDMIKDQVEQGRSEQEIRAFLIDRYGEYVSFKPSVNAKTTLLWMGPWLAMALALLWLRQVTKRKSV